MTLPLFKNFVDVIVLNHVTDYQKQQIELFFSSGGKKVQNAKFQAWKKDLSTSYFKCVTASDARKRALPLQAITIDGLSYIISTE